MALADNFINCMNRKHTTWHASHSSTSSNTTNKIEGDQGINNEGNSSSLEMSYENVSLVLSAIYDSEFTNPSEILKNIKIYNANRLVIGHININSLRKKYEFLKTLIKGNIDILVITESKLDESFPSTICYRMLFFALPF